MSGGRNESGCSCYEAYNYNGHSGVAYKRPTNEDHLTAKQINFCSKQSCKFSLNLINNVIAWLWNNQIWIVLSDND